MGTKDIRPASQSGSIEHDDHEFQGPTLDMLEGDNSARLEDLTAQGHCAPVCPLPPPGSAGTLTGQSLLRLLHQVWACAVTSPRDASHFSAAALDLLWRRRADLEQLIMSDPNAQRNMLLAEFIAWRTLIDHARMFMDEIRRLTRAPTTHADLRPHYERLPGALDHCEGAWFMLEGDLEPAANEWGEGPLSGLLPSVGGAQTFEIPVGAVVVGDTLVKVKLAVKVLAERDKDRGAHLHVSRNANGGIEVEQGVDIALKPLPIGDVTAALNPNGEIGVQVSQGPVSFKQWEVGKAELSAQLLPTLELGPAQVKVEIKADMERDEDGRQRGVTLEAATLAQLMQVQQWAALGLIIVCGGYILGAGAVVYGPALVAGAAAKGKAAALKGAEAVAWLDKLIAGAQAGAGLASQPFTVQLVPGKLPLAAVTALAACTGSGEDTAEVDLP